jgi:hypothetical protein
MYASKSRTVLMIALSKVVKASNLEYVKLEIGLKVLYQACCVHQLNHLELKKRS